MKYQLFFLVIAYLIIMLTLFFPLLQLNAQVPAEEFKMSPICSDKEFQPFENESNKRESTNKEKEEFFIYGNVSLGYKIEYPKDWKGIEKHCILEAGGLIQTSSIVNFMSTPNSSTNGLLGVAVGDFLEISIDEFIKVYSMDFSNMIESKEIITIDTKPSAKFIMNVGNDYKFTQITILSNDKKYDINYPISSLISNSTIQHMIESFEILEQDTSDSEDISEANELG